MTTSVKPRPSAASREREWGCNVAAQLTRIAETVPDQPSVIVATSRERSGRARYTQLTFRELEAQSNRYANGLTRAGIRRGARVLLMVRPGLEFIGLVFALFKLGAAPILIDPGMGARRMLACIRAVRPQAFIGIPRAHALRVIRGAAFERVEQVVTVGRRWFWGGPTLEQLSARAAPEFEPVRTHPDEMAAILFTSGSTGPAKGVVYEHGMFNAQVEAIRAHYGMIPGEVDLPTFPLFALFNPALGMTSVIPDMDASRPARVNPARIVEAIRDHGVTSTFGSPALWNRVNRYCHERGIALPTLRRVLVAGAPVPWQLVQGMRELLSPGADVHTPYGATEALPVASISGQALIPECSDRTRRGAGICVGRPVAGMTIRIIRISDEPIEAWSDDLELPQGVIGEIVVRGEVATKGYFGLPEADRLSKIREAGSRAETVSTHHSRSETAPTWHRMGDVGYFDDAGRLWFCGRKAHRVATETGTMFTIPCEAIFNEHPRVSRSALVGVGPAARKKPVMVIEPQPHFPQRNAVGQFKAELLDLASRNPLTAPIHQVLFHRGLPVDVRHNAKIDRESLAVWAARKDPGGHGGNRKD